MTPTILLVDDQPQNLLLLERMLEGVACRTVSARSGPEALALVEREPIDLVLLDVHMPGMSGLEVLTRLRERPSWIPIILVTADEQDHERLHGATAGADDFIEKPIVLEFLLARVRTLLALKATREALGQQNAVLLQLLTRQQELLEFTSRDLHGPLLKLQSNLRYARQLAASTEGGEEIVEGAVRDAVSASARIVGLTESLVAITLLERGDYPVRRSRVDVRQLIDEVLPTFTHEARARALQLTSDAPAGFIVIADERLLRRALESIVDLTIRESPPETIVRVDCRVDNGLEITIGRTRGVTEPAPSLLAPPIDPAVWPATQFCRRVMQLHEGTLRRDETRQLSARFVLHFPIAGPVAGTQAPRPEA